MNQLQRPSNFKTPSARAAGWLRKRLYLLFALLGLVWVVTLLTFYLSRGWIATNFHDLSIGVVSAWSVELTFFTFVGLALTLVTLRDPAHEEFTERLRILFDIADIPDAVLQHNKAIIVRSAIYIHEANRTLEVLKYDEAVGAYQVRIQTAYDYTNLLPDINFDASIPFGVTPDKFEGKRPDELGRITSIKVGGVEQLRKSILIEDAGFKSDIPLSISGRGTSSVLFEYTSWMKVDTFSSIAPSRVIEDFSMKIANRCDEPVRISIAADTRGPVSILFNQHYTFPTVQGYIPTSALFEFSFLRPSSLHK